MPPRASIRSTTWVSRAPGGTWTTSPLGPSGIFVIDAKKYSGAVQKRDMGGWFRTDERLYVNGRNRTNLVVAMQGQGP